jgi:hypothetical protein
MRAEELIDEDDWIEVEKSGPSKVLADVSIRLSQPERNGKIGKARAYIAFRGKAAEWIVANGPRFRVSIGGANANWLRIVPDIHRGKFEFGNSVGGLTKRLSLGHLAAWPDEDRNPTEAEWSVSAGYMRLRLPDDFAVARKSAPKQLPPPATAAAPATPPKPAAAPARSSNVVGMLGEPAPGRSALAQRR